MADSHKHGQGENDRRITRRRLVQAATAAGIAGLAGCAGAGGRDQGTETTTTASDGDGNARSLTVASWGGEVEQEIVTGILQDYDDQHENVSVEYNNTPFDQYSEKLKTQFAGNTEPDVFYLIADDAPTFMRNGALLELDPYVQNSDDYDFEPILDNLLEAFQYDGATYGVPKDFTSVGLFHNTAHLEEAGVDNSLETWSDLRSALETVKQETDVEYPMAFQSQPRNTLVQLIWQNGGRVLNEAGDESLLGSQEAIEALEFLVGLRDDELAGLYGSDLSSTWAAPALGEGNVTATMTGAWAVSTLEQEYSDRFESLKVANPMPIPEGGQEATIVFTTSWSASANTDAPEMSADLIKALTSTEGMWKWVKTGTALPAREPLLERDFYDERELLGGLANLAEIGRPLVFGPNTSRILDTVMSEAEGALTGSQSAAEAMEAAQRQINNDVL
jgi:multiple sugar transport system substrate-binding protein